MAKAVRGFDIVFDKDEVEFVERMRKNYILSVAKRHFLDKGMTEEEIEKKIQFGKIWDLLVTSELEDGTLAHGISEIRVEVTELLD